MVVSGDVKDSVNSVPISKGMAKWIADNFSDVRESMIVTEEVDSEEVLVIMDEVKEKA